jgi:hypothetical protein
LRLAGLGGDQQSWKNLVPSVRVSLGAFPGTSSREIYKRLKLALFGKMTISKYISNFSSPPRAALGKGVAIYGGSDLAVASGW